MSVCYIMEQCRQVLSSLSLNLGTKVLPQVPQDTRQHALERSNPLIRLKHLCFHHSHLWAKNRSFCNLVSSLSSLVVQMPLNAHDREIIVFLVGPEIWAMCDVT